MSSSLLTKENLQEAVNNSDSVLGVMRYLGIKPAGGSHAWVTKKLKRYEIPIDHFSRSGFRTGGHGKSKLPSEILILRLQGDRTRHSQLKRAMLECAIVYECRECSISDWNYKELTLEIDHINGNRLDDRLENLRFLCPNCHSQTVTYKNKKRI